MRALIVVDTHAYNNIHWQNCADICIHKYSSVIMIVIAIVTLSHCYSILC